MTVPMKGGTLHTFKDTNIYMYQEIFQLHERLYKALANQKRVEIVHLLRDKELTVSQIQEMLGLQQANLSQHLAILREHGLVQARRDGKEIYYKLAHPNLIKASDLMREMLVDQHRGHATLSEELRLRMKDLVPVVIDPVCGMRLSPKTAATALKLNGQTLYFCAMGCREQYLQNHKQRLTRKHLVSKKESAAAIYARK